MCFFVFCSLAAQPLRSWMRDSFGGFTPDKRAPGLAKRYSCAAAFSGRILACASAYSMNRKPIFGAGPTVSPVVAFTGAASTAMLRMPRNLPMPNLRCTTYSPGMSLNGSMELFGDKPLPPPVKNPLSTALFCSFADAASPKSSWPFSSLLARDSRSSSDSYPPSAESFALVPASSSNICWFSNLSRTRAKPRSRFSRNRRFSRSPGSRPPARVSASPPPSRRERAPRAPNGPRPRPRPRRAPRRPSRACLRDLL